VLGRALAMLCLKEAIYWAVYMLKLWVVWLWSIFLLRKWLKSLVKVVVNTPGAVESSWNPRL